ncbi:hypothetical protein RO3G_13205 [Rhizopus delemar RA 99-880]|uniref:Uncharacterized protein n=1 Tax=Rhizopus delemar (strain RA 99-880 / ATCC MYA-4621 / FGSC 9543 / NRRL 43880) TaxID=246409 RepID=I1CJ64_RHIO9|nr:hypothetical protein RO3G_13205 [Rhizopus delemar RA 99-880]|eukprot:EIE88494.1 hypothetical protein RO3G_13205 [Rhizopus delemar RA 99-880]
MFNMDLRIQALLLDGVKLKISITNAYVVSIKSSTSIELSDLGAVSGDFADSSGSSSILLLPLATEWVSGGEGLVKLEIESFLGRCLSSARFSSVSVLEEDEERENRERDLATGLMLLLVLVLLDSVK